MKHNTLTTIPQCTLRTHMHIYAWYSSLLCTYFTLLGSHLLLSMLSNQIIFLFCMFKHRTGSGLHLCLQFLNFNFQTNVHFLLLQWTLNSTTVTLFITNNFKGNCKLFLSLHSKNTSQKITSILVDMALLLLSIKIYKPIKKLYCFTEWYNLSVQRQ